MLGIGTLVGAWGIVSFGVCSAAFALYLFFAVERKAIPSPSLYSQFALFVMGVSVVFSAYRSIQVIISESGADEPNLVLVIGGFILVPIMALYGIAMTCCSVASKTASHGLLMYFATEPSRYSQKLF